MTTCRTPAQGDRVSPASHPDTWGAGLRFGAKALNTKSVKRARTPDEVLAVCLAHNLRSGNDGHRHRKRIDSAKTCTNQVLHGAACPVAAASQAADTLASLGIEPRRADAIVGLELVFQPPDGADAPAFWVACLAWVSLGYEHVISAVVHRDQLRPHMHVLVLAVRGGRLDGNAMTSGQCRFAIQRRAFMAYMRSELGLRPDRKVKTLAELAVSTGRGPKTRAQAERSDRALLQRATTGPASARLGMGVDGHGGWHRQDTDPHAQPETPTPLLRGLSRLESVFALWRLVASQPCASPAPMTPCPRPTGSASSDRLRAAQRPLQPACRKEHHAHP